MTADNLLSQPETVELVVEVTDQEFQVSDLEVVSEVMLEDEGVVFVLTGGGIQISCNVTGGGNISYWMVFLTFLIGMNLPVMR